MTTPYQLLGGEEAIRRLADAFYDVMDELPEVDTIRKMHGKSLADIKQKLFEYLSGWLGGPPLYYDKYNTICLTSPHKPYAIGREESEQWLLCMDKALERIDASDEVKAMLAGPMRELAQFMENK